MKVEGNLISFFQHISKRMSDFPHMNDSYLVIKLDSREKVSLFHNQQREGKKNNKKKKKNNLHYFLTTYYTVCDVWQLRG